MTHALKIVVDVPAQSIETRDGPMQLSICEAGVHPRFRLNGGHFSRAYAVTIRPDGSRQTFAFVNQGSFWQSADEVPEPYGFEVALTVGHDDDELTFPVAFPEREQRRSA